MSDLIVNVIVGFVCLNVGWLFLPMPKWLRDLYVRWGILSPEVPAATRR